MITYGLLTEEIGRGCSSVRSLLTVHDMVAHAIQRWGSPAQRERYLPAHGARRDARRPRPLRARGRQRRQGRRDHRCPTDGDAWVLDGRKKWTTFGQIAGLYPGLAQVRTASRPPSWSSARRPGLTVAPLHGHHRHPRLDARRDLPRGLPRAARAPGRPRRLRRLARRSPPPWSRGATASPGARSASSRPASTPAWATPPGAGSSACPIAEHQLIRAHAHRHDRRACAPPACSACGPDGCATQRRPRRLLPRPWPPSTSPRPGAPSAANDAVQIHGANGCSEEYPVGRYLRDSRVMEIIEGSTQIQQITIPLSSSRSSEWPQELQTTPPPSTRRRRKRSSRSSAWSGTSTTPSGTASCSRTPR